MQAAPLVIALPFFFAAVLSIAGARGPRWLIDGIAGVVSALQFLLCAWLAKATTDQPFVYWFGGWKPTPGAAVGISFFIDPVGAGLAALASLLTLAAFVFSIRYFKAIHGLFHALMLIFLGAMCGFSLTSDLFNLFVWFELMGATGIALCGYKVEELGPLQGALNFGVTQSVGAFLGLTGIIILYGRTGALNLAQLALALDNGAPSALVIISFAFIACGFLVKAAAVPFHFWLADAHAVAPTPVCVLFSGVMVELGLYAVVRIHGAIYSGVLASRLPTLHAIFLVMGVLTAILGGIMSFAQRHLKRILAYSTISHIGLMLIALSFFRADATAGLGFYLLGHGMIKAALFICVGILLNLFACVDEQELRGRGKPYLGLGMLFGALGLSGLPPFITFKGIALIENAAELRGEGWVSWIYVAAGALTSGAVFRVWGRVFHGWGIQEPAPTDSATGKDEKSETQGSLKSIWLLYAPAIALLALSITPGWSPAFVKAILGHAPGILDHAAYQRAVLAAAPFAPPAPPAMPDLRSATLHGVISVLLAIALAFAGLKHRASSRHPWNIVLTRALHALRALHSGEVGDYLTWFTVGVALYAGFMVWG